MLGHKSCALHRVQAAICAFQKLPLWSFTASRTLADVRTCMQLLGAKGAAQMGWKAWRAGRASAMAAAGDSLEEILTAGEWRSIAVLNYLNESQIDASRMLLDAVEESDEESLPVL